MPVEKFASADANAKTALEAGCLCFMGSNVVSGSATAVIAATGGNTYFGALAGSLVGRRVQTSFDKGVGRFAWLMIRFMFVMAPLVFIINGVTKHAWYDALMLAVSVAVGLTPEMLPMIVAINLAKGALKMAKKDVIVKRLNAIQNFGAINVLCTDENRHADAGSCHPRTPHRYLRRRKRESSRIRVAQQLSPDGIAQLAATSPSSTR